MSLIHPLAAFALAGTTALALVPALSAQEVEALDLRVALNVVDANFNPTTSSIFALAEDMGYFDRHGVNVEYIKLDGSPAAAAALLSGVVDLAYLTIDSTVRLRADNDLPVRGILATGVGGGGGFFLIAAREEIAEVPDLAGRAFAIADSGSFDHQLTNAVLRDQGLDPSEVNFVAIGAPDVRVQALAAGQIDATTVSFGTWSSVSELPGMHVLVPPEDVARNRPGLSSYVAGLEGTLEEKREAIQRYTNAMVEAARALEADPEGWVDAAAAARPDLTRENLETISGGNQNSWCINGCMNPLELEQAVNFIYENPEFYEIERLDYTDLVDLSFTITAMEELGVAGGPGRDARE